MSLWSRIFAALYDPAFAAGERRGMAARRTALLAAARGRVLEIGAGTGLNLPHYPAGLTALTLTEPAPEMAVRLRRKLADGSARTGAPVELVEASADALPFADGTFDTVVATLVLCTVPDPDATVREIRRVLAPGGALLFVEHVRAPDGTATARWQDRLVRPWRAIGEGCTCNRDTLATLRAHFPDTDAREEEWAGMAPLVRPLVVGAAR